MIASVETFRGYVVKQRKGMVHWESLLEEWLLANERYCRIIDNDAPFIYTERANIGLLAGAAWRCGRVSLEEFQSKKGFKNRPKWNGRADLFMATENVWELVEAKMKWLSLLRSSNQVPRVNDTLAKAISDAKKTRGDNSRLTSIGVAFFPVYLPCSKTQELNGKIEYVIQTLLKEANYHCFAWCFPKEIRFWKSENNNFNPGVIMVASNCNFK